MLTVINPHWKNGMSSSIRIGIETLASSASYGPRMDAAVIMLCDQPFVTTQVIDELVTAYRASGRPIIASAYEGTVGLPAQFAHQCSQISPGWRRQKGRKRLSRNMPEMCFCIPFTHGAIDIDTPMD
jgi:molybdenum cofactor cytidylyltransferase